MNDHLKARLINVRHGRKERSHIIYGTLVDMEGKTLIAATLFYILEQIQSRGYILVEGI